MSRTQRPHVLGIDDAPFDKGQHAPVPIVGVMMESADLVEGVVITSFPVDGDAATGFLAEWIGGLRLLPSVQAVVLGGITIAGLGVVDLSALSAAITRPVLAVTRSAPTNAPLVAALAAAGLADRRAIVEASPRAERVADGLYAARAGLDADAAARLIRATLGKARVPEALRVAHLVGAALVTGASRGRA